jgi:hypothetical protein
LAEVMLSVRPPGRVPAHHRPAGSCPPAPAWPPRAPGAADSSKLDTGVYEGVAERHTHQTIHIGAPRTPKAVMPGSNWHQVQMT